VQLELQVMEADLVLLQEAAHDERLDALLERLLPTPHDRIGVLVEHAIEVGLLVDQKQR